MNLSLAELKYVTAEHNGMRTKFQMKKWILKSCQYYETKREKGPNETS